MRADRRVRPILTRIYPGGTHGRTRATRASRSASAATSTTTPSGRRATCSWTRTWGESGARRPGRRPASGIAGSERCPILPSARAAGGCRVLTVAPRGGRPSRPGPGGWTTTVRSTTRPRCSCAASPATGRRTPATGERTALTTAPPVVAVLDRISRLLTLDDQNKPRAPRPGGGTRARDGCEQYHPQRGEHRQLLYVGCLTSHCRPGGQGRHRRVCHERPLSEQRNREFGHTWPRPRQLSGPLVRAASVTHTVASRVLNKRGVWRCLRCAVRRAGLLFLTHPGRSYVGRAAPRLSLPTRSSAAAQGGVFSDNYCYDEVVVAGPVVRAVPRNALTEG